jgi:PAS domain S-box-containing protein
MKPFNEKKKSLREKAENVLSTEERLKIKNLSEADTLALIHELHVHQIELELQNQEIARAQLEAQMAADRYIELYDFSPIGYFTLSKSGFIQEVNFSGAALFGETRAFLKDKKFADFLSDDSKFNYSQLLLQLDVTKIKHSCEVDVHFKKVKKCLILSGILNEKREQFFISATDISELKSVEHELMQSKELRHAQLTISKQNEEIVRRNESLELEIKSRTQELLDYNHQLEQFAFISAHNLRSPVARILGLANLLDLSSTNPEDNRMILQKMVNTAKELDRVVHDLNTIIEIKKNSSNAISQIVFVDVLEKVAKFIEKEIRESTAIIISDFSLVQTVKSVAPYVESIIYNLLSNAIKYRYPGRQPIIKISSEKALGFSCLVVSDNGLGIDIDLAKDKIFNLYQRFHNHVDGKGLGLYLIRTQIESLGGRIEVTSKINEGTTFRVYFKD